MTLGTRSRIGIGALALALAWAGLARGAEGDGAKTQTIDAGGLTFDAPAAWKSNKPSSTMRRAELKVAPVKGDDDPAELVVFAFPGGAGGVEANIKRWQSQFKDEDGNPPKVATTEAKGKNVTATRVAIAGHYYPSQFPGQPKQSDKPNYRLLGAIVLTDATGYFLKMVGPEKTMAAAGPAFDELIASLKTGN